MIKKINDKYALVSKSGKPLAYYKGEGKPTEEWVEKEEARIKYFKHKLGEEYSDALDEIYTPLLEIIHPNMLGIAELYRFNLAATPEQKAQHKQHFLNKDYQSAWNLVSNVLNIGKINADIYKPDPKPEPNRVDIATAAGTEPNSKNNNLVKFEALFNEFINSIIVEELHPELKAVVSDTKDNYKSKQARIVSKIRELASRGEATGVEGNMPKGSSRAFLFEEAPRDVTIDGTPAKLPVGTKVAIRSSLDKFHDKSKYMDKSLGELQQMVENNDPEVNKKFRILTKNADSSYTTNEENGIFPPLVDHDKIAHQYSTVGVCGNLNGPKFRELTTTSDFPSGITHKNFVDAIWRVHEMGRGKYWEQSDKTEAKLDKLSTHPLVRKFHQHGGNPYDYSQLKNLGVFTHPVTKKQYIVGLDHGFSHLVSEAYTEVHRKQMKQYLR